ncbi:Dipeptidyl aminopeptidase BI [Austwickia sp. TVS 96-490-7B]|uniref:S9 family peptidase n=1 Tax=Austwickia sp. TVS 96-490-7B TaxID=2830843 RepID=UPI001C58C392|nr:S9 family peptidase [Austwickia sp. TVS 96-490-7B]MBW3084390.1 Dipeptidyl aminopeptidase BI [Austwickia sp. TVS 96-490-7B]
MPIPPRPSARPVDRIHHGDCVVDEFSWLQDRSDPQVVAHLEAENVYAREVTAGQEELRERIVAEIKARTKETDLSVPVAWRGWWYYARTQEGHQYPAECRVPVVPGEPRPAPQPGCPWPGEQVLVDGEVEAAGGDYLAFGASEVCPAGDLVAFSVDRSGDERFDVVIRRIADGVVVDDALRGVGYGLAWSWNSDYLVYCRVDESWRPYQVWMHRVGSDPAQDQLLLQEDDERFWLGFGTSKDDRRLLVAASSKTTGEWWIGDLSAQMPSLAPVAGRIPGWEYEVEWAGDGLLVTHNQHGVDFEVSWAPWPTSGETASGVRTTGDVEPRSPREGWRGWLAPQQGVRYLGVEAFAGQVLVSLRREGQQSLQLFRRVGAAPERWDGPVEVAPQEELYSVSTESNPQWDATSLRVVYESFVTPRTVAEVDVTTGRWEVLKRQEVLGGYDPADYVQRREWVRAPDGARVPLSIVHRVGVEPDGTAPVLLYGYGAYETSLDPWFSMARLSMLDRGVVFAVGHVRGGGEMGRSWYEQGKLEQKASTFTDMVACAQHLHERGWCAPDRLALSGGSAGGLTVGATVNLAPELFAVVHADVPFVDALTTMLDESLPLTVTEWEEWGDPLHDAQAYAVMKSYSPYENLRPVEYPTILATTSLNDTRVSCAEPAKWVARMREMCVQDQSVRPVVLHTEMVAGHGGRSGRYAAWEQYAFEAAFVLSALGVRH